VRKCNLFDPVFFSACHEIMRARHLGEEWISGEAAKVVAVVDSAWYAHVIEKEMTLMNIPFRKPNKMPSLLRRFTVGVVGVLSLSSCSTYPLGDSHYPHYFGGHGSAARPTGHVPGGIQRNNEMLP
jgi:hypothetical protein